MKKGLSLTSSIAPCNLIIKQVPRLMQEFERDVLARYTPCSFDNLESVLEALAITHCELVLIHPFRDGNGRVSRLLSQLMDLQAGLPLLNFQSLKASSVKLILPQCAQVWSVTMRR